MIVGIMMMGALMTMLRVFMALPAMFIALIVKLKAPVVVGVPEISPVLGFNFNPGGRKPLQDHCIGAVPVALIV